MARYNVLMPSTEESPKQTSKASEFAWENAKGVLDFLISDIEESEDGLEWLMKFGTEVVRVDKRTPTGRRLQQAVDEAAERRLAAEEAIGAPRIDVSGGLGATGSSRPASPGAADRGDLEGVAGTNGNADGAKAGGLGRGIRAVRGFLAGLRSRSVAQPEVSAQPAAEEDGSPARDRLKLTGLAYRDGRFYMSYPDGAILSVPSESSLGMRVKSVFWEVEHSLRKQLPHELADVVHSPGQEQETSVAATGAERRGHPADSEASRHEEAVPVGIDGPEVPAETLPGDGEEVFENVAAPGTSRGQEATPAARKEAARTADAPTQRAVPGKGSPTIGLAARQMGELGAVERTLQKGIYSAAIAASSAGEYDRFLKACDGKEPIEAKLAVQHLKMFLQLPGNEQSAYLKELAAIGAPIEIIEAITAAWSDQQDLARAQTAGPPATPSAGPAQEPGPPAANPTVQKAPEAVAQTPEERIHSSAGQFIARLEAAKTPDEVAAVVEWSKPIEWDRMATSDEGAAREAYERARVRVSGAPLAGTPVQPAPTAALQVPESSSVVGTPRVKGGRLSGGTGKQGPIAFAIDMEDGRSVDVELGAAEAQKLITVMYWPELNQVRLVRGEAGWGLDNVQFMDGRTIAGEEVEKRLAAGRKTVQPPKLPRAGSIDAEIVRTGPTQSMG
jgi:hypothetical protein